MKRLKYKQEYKQINISISRILSPKMKQIIKRPKDNQATRRKIIKRPKDNKPRNSCVSSVCKKKYNTQNLRLAHFGYGTQIQKILYKQICFVGRMYFGIEDVRTLCVQRQMPYHLLVSSVCKDNTTSFL